MILFLTYKVPLFFAYRKTNNLVSLLIKKLITTVFKHVKSFVFTALGHKTV